MDILIAPIGEQDPFSKKNNQPGSAVAIADRVQPKITYLLPTKKPDGSTSAGTETYAQAELTREVLQQRIPGIVVEIVPLVVDKPNLPDQIFGALMPLIERVRKECAIWASEEPLTTIHVNAGSGTPAIKEAVTLLASSGVLAQEGQRVEVYVVDDPAHVAAGENRVHAVDIGYLEELRLAPTIRSLFEARQWALARENLERMATLIANSDRLAVALTVSRVLSVFGILDQLSYTRAQSVFRDLLQRRETRRTVEVLPEVAELLSESGVCIDRLAKGERYPILYDLLAGMEHRVHRGEYADALGRGWNLTESALRERLRVYHNLDLDMPTPSAEQKRRLGSSLALDDQGRIKSEQYVGSLWRSLLNLEDPVLKSIDNGSVPGDLAASINAELTAQLRVTSRLADALKRTFRNALGARPAQPCVTVWANARDYLNAMRNNSIVAHGEHEVSEIAARTAVELAREVLRGFSAPQPAVTDQAHLDRFARCLESVLRHPGLASSIDDR